MKALVNLSLALLVYLTLTPVFVASAATEEGCGRFFEKGQHSTQAGSIDPQAQKAAKIFSQILNDENDLQENGEFIHRIWQEVNIYLTRFKNMAYTAKDGGAIPITDINEYIRKNNIPSHVRVHYKPSTKGWVEDIRQIDNRYLSPENNEENYEGGKDYLVALSDLLKKPVATQKEAIQAVKEALQQVHSLWLPRNDKKWGAAQYNDKDVTKISPNSQYNNFYILKSILNKHVQRSDFAAKSSVGLIFTAFERVDKDLNRLRLENVAQLTPGAAYYKLSQEMGGTKISLADKGLYRFFKDRMPEVHPTTRKPHPQSQDLERWRAYHEAILQIALHSPTSLSADRRRHTASLQEKKLRLVLPGTLPASGAFVYLVVDENDRVVSVLKVQGEKLGGMDEVLSNLAMDHHFVTNSSSGVEVAKALSYGVAGDDFFILQTPAKEMDIDTWLRKSNDPYEILKATAEAQVALHGPYDSKSRKGIQIKVFQGNSFYDIQALRNLIAPLDETRSNIFDVAIENGEISTESADALKRRSLRLIGWYDRVVENHPWILAPTLIHGDLHGGNLFLDSATGVLTYIDYGTMSYFLGTGDRANDVGRMVAHLMVEKIKDGKWDSQAGHKEAAFFLDEYVKKANMTAAQARVFKAASQVYSMRYLALQLNDTDGDKFVCNSKNCTMKKARQQLFEVWSILADIYGRN